MRSNASVSVSLCVCVCVFFHQFSKSQDDVSHMHHLRSSQSSEKTVKLLENHKSVRGQGVWEGGEIVMWRHRLVYAGKIRHGHRWH